MRDLLDRIGGHRVLVVGDIYLDHYIFGSPHRLSREAPVMVLDEDRHEHRLGGGAAPALALRKLGFDVAIGGVVGNDSDGETVIELLNEAGIDVEYVTVDPTRPTTVKLRVVAEGFHLFPQQLVRIDRQDRLNVPANVERVLCRAIRSADGAAVLVSDYRSGVITSRLVSAINDFQQVRGALTTVDSQGDLSKFRQFDLIKCNQPEAEQVLGQQLDNDKLRQDQLQTLRDELACPTLVVTRGESGAVVVTKDAYAEVPAMNRSEVFDVTGAGDTVVAVMTAGLLAGADPVQSAQLAQIAAGLVVRKWGNAQASRDEIARAISAG